MAIRDLLFLLDFGSLCIFSFLLIRRLRAVFSRMEKIALTLGLGFGLKSLMLFSLLTLHIPPGIYTQLGLSIFTLLAYCLIFRKTAHLPENKPRGFNDKVSFHLVLACGILGILFLFSLINAWFFPITESDGIWYHIKGKIFQQEARFDSDLILSQFRQYPPLVPLLFSYLISWEFDNIKILFPVFYLCLLIIFYFRVYDHSKNQKLAAIFTLLLGTTPYFWWHSVLPFLDLTTGFYYSAGALYWFSLVDKISKERKTARPAEHYSLALLSGTFFGFAAWNRPEFLLYNSIPLILLVYVLNQKSTIGKKEGKILLSCFMVSLLFLPTLWLCVLFSFDHPLEKRMPALAAICAAQWITAFCFIQWDIPLNKKIVLTILISALVLYLLLMMIGGPKSVSWGMGILIALTRTFSVQIFFSFTVFLFLFLFFQNWRELSHAEKMLGAFLILYPIIHFAIFSYSEPRWTKLKIFAEATFLQPGNSVNLSDARGMMSFYPVFVFFISRLSNVRKAFENE